MLRWRVDPGVYYFFFLSKGLFFTRFFISSFCLYNMLMFGLNDASEISLSIEFSLEKNTISRKKNQTFFFLNQRNDKLFHIGPRQSWLV